MYQQDWILRQVQMIMQTILHADDRQSMLLQEQLEYEVEDLSNSKQVPDVGSFYYDIMALLNTGQINQAENMLFEAVRQDEEKVHLLAAMDFYANLFRMNDDFLKKHSYTREEIGQGLKDILQLYHIQTELT